MTIAGALLGVAAVPVSWIAVSSISGGSNMATNVALHAVGIAVLLVVLRVPRMAERVEGRLVDTHRGDAA